MNKYCLNQREGRKNYYKIVPDLSLLAQLVEYQTLDLAVEVSITSMDRRSHGFLKLHLNLKELMVKKS